MQHTDQVYVKFRMDRSLHDWLTHMASKNRRSLTAEFNSLVQREKEQYASLQNGKTPAVGPAGV